jgi:hypothetical protein
LLATVVAAIKSALRQEIVQTDTPQKEAQKAEAANKEGKRKSGLSLSLNHAKSSCVLLK